MPYPSNGAAPGNHWLGGEPEAEPGPGPNEEPPVGHPPPGPYGRPNVRRIRRRVIDRTLRLTTSADVPTMTNGTNMNQVMPPTPCA